MNPNAIAAGDNPAKLTNAQVGAGYRLTFREPIDGFSERDRITPEVLTEQMEWVPVTWERIDEAEHLDQGIPTRVRGTDFWVLRPFTFRVPLTPAFIAWKAKQRPERAAAERRRDQRISEANAEILKAKQDYSMARKGAFQATAHEYGYVPPGDSVSQGFVDDRGVVHKFPVIQFNWVPATADESFPMLPPGVTQYNPENLTAAQVGVSKGYRLYRSDDTGYFEDTEAYDGDEWKPWGPRNKTFEEMGFPNFSFRTKAPPAVPYYVVPILHKRPLEFPTLPTGAEWYNPAGLTPEEYGVAEGWRPFCTLDKTFGNGQRRSCPDSWFSFYDSAHPPKWYFDVAPKGLTPHRTKAPIPTA